jgi:hypothetical protein
MSEIKGQILGIVLVLAIFGAVATIMITLFSNTASDLETKVSNNIESVLLAKNNAVVDADLTF